jgi:hypothetical protein
VNALHRQINQRVSSHIKTVLREAAVAA